MEEGGHAKSSMKCSPRSFPAGAGSGPRRPRPGRCGVRGGAGLGQMGDEGVGRR